MQRLLGTVNVREQREVYADRSLKGARWLFAITILLGNNYWVSREEFFLYLTGGFLLIACFCLYFGVLVTSFNRDQMRNQVKELGFEDVALLRDNRRFTALQDGKYIEGCFRRQDNDFLAIYINN